MKLVNEIIIMKSQNLKGIQSEIVGLGEFTINQSNIFDIIENSLAGTSDYIFTHEDRDFPAVRIEVSHTRTGIGFSANYLVDDNMSIPIADKSSGGLMKWLIRALNNKEGDTSIFELNILKGEGISKNEQK